MLKYQDLISGIKQGNIFPLYLFFGEEEFLIQEAVNLVINKVVDPGTRDFNFNTLYCKDTSSSELVNLCMTLPFMSEKRLVIAKEGAVKNASLDLASTLRSRVLEGF
jgi:DNA polymerase-3 subunit delta